MAGHGGKRNGAGRKKGGANQKTREIAERVAREGITPLEVMVEVMRWHLEEKRYDEAAAVAKDAAPYMHPRLQAIQVGGSDGPAIPVAIVEVVNPHSAGSAGADPASG
jgi:hypothetical protein